jgi:hypothetical protein
MNSCAPSSFSSWEIDEDRADWLILSLPADSVMFSVSATDAKYRSCTRVKDRAMD